MIQIAYDPVYTHPLPEGHRFPMLKYELIAGQLLYEGSFKELQFVSPESCSEEIILLTHTRKYLDKLLHQRLSPSEQRHIGFPQSPLLTARERIITQGTIDCSLHALQYGIALNVAGGTHHAFADHGEGFCLLNDAAVAANFLLHERLAEKILIIDLDVHQGNGTAALFRENPDVFVFSIHGIHNYPFRKEKSDLDIGLKDGTTDAEYLSILKETMLPLIAEYKPDIAFYNSGVDILQSDRFGKFDITMDGCKKRDEIVFSALRLHSIPVCVAMGGGYSTDIKLIVEAHCNTFRTAAAIFE